MCSVLRPLMVFLMFLLSDADGVCDVISCKGSVLRRWKKNWFVLYTDGMLKYFESPDSHVAEEAIVIPAKLLTLKTAHQVNS